MSLLTWSYAPAGTPVESLGANQYTEAEHSNRITYAPGGSYITRIFYVADAILPSFLDDLFGYSSLIGTAITRVLPDQHRLYDTYFAFDGGVEPLSIQGKNTTFNIPTYTASMVTANYRPVDYAVLSDAAVAGFTTDAPELHRYVTRGGTFAGDYLTLQGGMKFITSKLVLEAPPGRVIGNSTKQYMWHEVPAKTSNPFAVPNETTIMNCLGKVNSITFDLTANNGTGFVAGTVLFQGVEARQLTPKFVGTQYYWELVYSFLIRDYGSVPINTGGGPVSVEIGHNFVYDVKNGRWDMVTSDGNYDPTFNKTIYQTADLNALFIVS